MAPKPTEVKLVTQHLLAESPDADTLAKTIITELDAKREQEALREPPYALVYWEPNSQVLCVYGPYRTENQARKQQVRLASPGPLTASCWVLRQRPEVRDASQ